MIHKLKKKFTILATVSMVLLMVVLVGIMNLINYSSVVTESDATLELLRQTSTPVLEKKDPEKQPVPNTETETETETKTDTETEDSTVSQIEEVPVEGGFPSDIFASRGMSPEVFYESRYFVVQVAADGTISGYDLSKIISVDEETLSGYVEAAMASSGERGFVTHFRYLKVSSGDTTQIMFLDCGRKLDAFLTFLWVSLGVGLSGCVIVFLVFLFFSGRIVNPIAESYEKQKRFISDASHEIKTPLTIINANVDLLELDGEKEELTEIRTQTKRLTALTKDLVTLTKMEESDHQMPKVECPVSDLVLETSNSFRAPALSREIAFTTEVTPGITLNGSPDALRQLVSVLMENAVKYTPEKGQITLHLEEQKKTVIMIISNTTYEKIDSKELPHLFDRFYRSDASRNSETGGHGIGLSIAKAIVDNHNGTIVAAMKDGPTFEITVSLPKA